MKSIFTPQILIFYLFETFKQLMSNFIQEKRNLFPKRHKRLLARNINLYLRIYGVLFKKGLRLHPQNLLRIMPAKGKGKTLCLRTCTHRVRLLT